MKVTAIQGLRGSYSEEAALKLQDGDTEILECGDFADVLDAVMRQRAEFAVLPTENKIIGAVAAAALIEASALRVLGELQLPVRHVLAGAGKATLADLRIVRSQAEALEQCSDFLAAHPQLVQQCAPDSALSIKSMVEIGNVYIGAIGSPRAAQLYGATVLREGVANDPENWTKFCLLGR
jgi:prephenate dehydratase